MAGGCALHYTACTNTPCSTARFHCSEHVLVLVHRLIPSNKRSLKKRQSVSLKIRHFHALFFFIYFCFLSSFPIPIVTNQCGPRVCEVQLTPPRLTRLEYFFLFNFSIYLSVHVLPFIFVHFYPSARLFSLLFFAIFMHVDLQAMYHQFCTLLSQRYFLLNTLPIFHFSS